MGSLFSAADGSAVGLYMNDKPTFKNNAGFCYKRQQRKMCIQEAALVSAKIPPEYRDYCAHYLLEYKKCRYKQMPLVYRCAHEKHIYMNCEKEDYVNRMKEFEREKRLRVREERIKKEKCK